MSVISNNQLAGAAGQGGDAGFKIDRSLRFNKDDSAHLNRTPSSAGNRKTWTWSGWVKRGVITSSANLFAAYNGSSYATSNFIQAYFTNDDRFRIFGSAEYFISTAVFRDVSAWGHIVISCDTTQSSADDRFKVYWNGVRVPRASGSVTQNDELAINNTIAHYHGSYNGTNELFDGYMTEIHFIDGQALAPTYFGETDNNGVWQPKEFDGSYTSAASGTTTSLSQTGWNPSHSGNIWDGNASSSSRATGYLGGTEGTVSFFPALTNVTKVEIWTQNYVHYLNGVSVSTPESVNGGWHTLYNNSGSPITLKSVGNAYNGNNTQTVDIAGIRINDSIVNSQTWTPPTGVGLHNIGLNSFYLNFADNSSNAALGTDSSGNSNTWTVNNLIANDGSAPAKTLTRLRFKTAWNWMYVSQITINGSALTTGTLNNSGSWSNPTLWKNGSVGSGNETSSQSASGLYFDVTLATPIANFNDLAIYLYLDASSGGNLFEVELFFDDSSTHTRVYASNSDAPTGNFNGRFLQNFGKLGTVASSAVDSLIDTPTNYEAASGNNGGNYCVMNPLDMKSNVATQNGNMEVKNASAGWSGIRGTLGVSSGKWYYELKTETASIFAGIATAGVDINANAPQDTTSVLDDGTLIYCDDGKYLLDQGGSSNRVSYGGALANGHILGVAIDLDGNTVQFYKNNLALGSIDISSSPLASNTVFPYYISYYTSTSTFFNFGQRPFAYTPPTGYKSLCTQNLPDPTVPDGGRYFRAITRTGGGTNQSFTYLNPGLVLQKNRTDSGFYYLYDKVRGDNAYMHPNNENGEVTGSGAMLFSTNGYVVQSSFDWPSNKAIIDWVWDAGSSNTSVSAGSLNSSAYDQSQTWSSNYTGSNGVAPTNAFDGTGPTQNGYAHQGASLTLNFSPALSGRIIVYGGTGGGGADTYTLSDGSSLSSNVLYNVSPYWSDLDFGEKTGITSLTCSAGYTLYGIRVGGKLLVDQGITLTNVPSIASTVRANPSAGFSIVTYTGTEGGTFGHGLNAAPEMVIVKRRNSSAAWTVWHKAIPNTQYLMLDKTTSPQTANVWGDTSPTSSVVSVSGDSYTGNNGDNYVAYCFTSIEGYSSIGSYDGNGTSNNTFVYTGFKPKFILFRNTSSHGGDWMLLDTERRPNGSTGGSLVANVTNAEDSYYNNSQVGFDFLSNGFKIRHHGSPGGDSGRTYLYAAFAEHPFKTARAY